jgi:formylglycine-generating enzyme required for sulfatase activity
MLFIIVVIGNMLSNTFGNPLGIFKNIMGTLWELKKTPSEHHGNHFETLKNSMCTSWEPFGTMLGNTFGNPLGIFNNIMGTVWELKKTPSEHHGNRFETLKNSMCTSWEPFGNMNGTHWEHQKSSKIRIVKKSTFESFLRISKNWSRKFDLT